MYIFTVVLTPLRKGAIPTSPKATAYGHLRPQHARTAAPSSALHPRFVTKAADLPTLLQKNQRMHAWGGFYINSSCRPVNRLLQQHSASLLLALRSGRAKTDVSSATCTHVLSSCLKKKKKKAVTSIRLNRRAIQSLSGFHHPFLDES